MNVQTAKQNKIVHYTFIIIPDNYYDLQARPEFFKQFLWLSDGQFASKRDAKSHIPNTHSVKVLLSDFFHGLYNCRLFAVTAG